MEYIRVQSIKDPLFVKMHQLMQVVFPPEEVYAFEKWEGPLQDGGIHVYTAVEGDEVVGATEYRYYSGMRVAMTDFTIIGKANSGVGRFLLRSREKHLARLAKESGTKSIGMFAEIYNPQTVDYSFGGIAPMNPHIRREVLSHIGYKRLDFPYLHPSWQENGEAVDGLDLCFLPQDEELGELPSALVAEFLTTYYSALPDKPAEWQKMIDNLKKQETIALKPI
ncbi:GNAT family N-acetyltransferase [Paenibacillus nasutitermitis]|uniref:Uncharacterized protein n=1 Tax=Paenibacillus nasutitermitis TaxID=1652958 RepID=A0A916YVX9_9BACL|nr:GNAT family N-acetyltransferase [Paenibacillus nasutitermitis]GGD63746.1 hypothetical protein GCM10010911_21890 [Paenibacillus nasutitermitis]